MSTTVRNETFSDAGARILEFGRSATPQQWKSDWRVPDFALGRLGSCWKSAPTWRVAEFEAELGFFVEGMGFDLNALAPELDGAPYAMLAAPDRDCTFALKGATAEAPAVQEHSLVLEFMLADVHGAFERCVGRGSQVLRAPWDDAGMVRASLRSPNGIEVGLWQDPTLAADRLPRFTDTMFRVDDLEGELAFWTGSMQYEVVHQDDDFAMLRDRHTGQRLTLVRFTEVDAPYALMAMKADDLDAAIAALEDRGQVDVKHRGEDGDWALCCLRDTYPIILWTENR